MPTGQPDFSLSSQEQRVTTEPDRVPSTVERIIREAIEAGDFDDLPGAGEPIPGAGSVDDDMWWVRSWLRRNRRPSVHEPDDSS